MLNYLGGRKFEIGLKLLWAYILMQQTPWGGVVRAFLPKFSAVLPGPLPRFPARLLPVALPQAGRRNQTLRDNCGSPALTHMTTYQVVGL